MRPPTNNRRKRRTNIIFMRKSLPASQHETQNVKTNNITTHKVKEMSNMDPTKKKPRCTRVLENGTH